LKEGVMIYRRLRQLEAAGEEIKIGVVGAGKFGTDVVTKAFQMPGMRAAIIADIKADNAFEAYAISGIGKEDVVVANTLAEANDAIARGRFVFTEDSLVVTQSDIDVVFEVTGGPDNGSLVAYHAITNGKHIVMVNVEADVTVGPILKKMADAAGVVYSCAYGDQPGVIMELYDWADALGFEVVVAGRGTKRYPFDREGTPDDTFERYGFEEEWITSRRLNPYMYTSFRDGTKSQIESTCVANMTGLVPDIRGMHEPGVNIPDLPKVFALKEDGGILNQSGVVDLANCVASDGKTILEKHVAVGVFIVISTDVLRFREEFPYWLHVGSNGKYATLYREYHLCGMEAPLTAAWAAIYHEPTGAPIGAPVADVFAVAKRDIKTGEKLDGSGGYTVYGLIDRAEIVRGENLLPLGLSYGVPTVCDIPKGTPITYDMVEPDESSFTLTLRRMQDAYRW